MRRRWMVAVPGCEACNSSGKASGGPLLCDANPAKQCQLIVLCLTGRLALYYSGDRNVTRRLALVWLADGWPPGKASERVCVEGRRELRCEVA